MKKFRYIAPQTIEEAVALLREHENAKIIAGGLDILYLMKQECLPKHPDVLVDINRIPGLSYVKEEGGALKIGATTKVVNVARSSIVQEKYPFLTAIRRKKSLHLISTIAFGATICQDVWCWYYRARNNHYNCIRKGGPICYAVAGDNRWMHSIFGGIGGCYATHQSDLSPKMIALDAVVRTTQRTMPIEDLYAVETPSEPTTLMPDEILTEVQIPTPKPNTKIKGIKFALRKGIDFPIVNVDVALTYEGKTCVDARVGLNGVYVTPYRATSAEEAIKGKVIDESTAEEAGKAVAGEAVPLSKNAWKVQLAKTLVKDAILATAA